MVADNNLSNSPGKVSDFKLKFSYWYVTNKLRLRKLLIIFLILLNASFFGFSIYLASMILLVQQQEYRQLLSSLPIELIDYEYFREKNKPQPLELIASDVIKGTEDKYDFIIKLVNPNEKMVVKNAVIQLVSNNQVVAERNTFVYPGQAKYVAFFGQENINPASAQIRIAQVDWQRNLDFTSFSQPRLNFEITDIEFKSVRESGLQGDLPVSSLSFKIKNASAYNYWQVGIQMILSGGQKIGGANYIALDQFKSGEEREVEMRWYEPLPAIYDIEILPEVDILDPASYMPVE